MAAFTQWIALAGAAMAKPRYSSNSGIFAKRGDPWVSRREGEKGFGRNLETENPELDQFTRARKAESRPKYVDPKPQKAEASFAHRKANALRVMHREMSEASRQTIVVDSRAVVFRPCPGCRTTICIAKRMCQVQLKGSR
jgi:hypothetical protein